jgi:AcrR family transcriptional regulator
MSTKERRLRQKEAIRSSILSTAWEMVKTSGWQSLSIRKIADAIEYSVPVIYDHFENKEAILQEISREGYLLLAKKARQAKEKHDHPAEQLKAIAEAYWNFAFKNKEYYQLMYGVGMACCESKKCMPVKDSFDDLLKETITQLIARSKRPDANPCLKQHTFWSILHGLISIKLMGNSNVSDKLNKLVMEDAMNGFIKNLD